MANAVANNQTACGFRERLSESFVYSKLFETVPEVSFVKPQKLILSINNTCWLKKYGSMKNPLYQLQFGTC